MDGLGCLNPHWIKISNLMTITTNTDSSDDVTDLTQSFMKDISANNLIWLSGNHKINSSNKNAINIWSDNKLKMHDGPNSDVYF